MAIPFNTLLEESKCYLCLGISQAEAMQLALLNRVAEGGGVLVYRALLTQNGVVAPVATVLENTLGVTPVYSYLGIGQYQLTVPSGLTTNKTAVSFGDNSAQFTTLSPTGFLIFSWDISAPALSDDIFRDELVQILVYP